MSWPSLSFCCSEGVNDISTTVMFRALDYSWTSEQNRSHSSVALMSIRPFCMIHFLLTVLISAGSIRHNNVTNPPEYINNFQSAGPSFSEALTQVLLEHGWEYCHLLASEIIVIQNIYSTVQCVLLDCFQY